MSYQGWKNEDTWGAALIIKNTRELHFKYQKLNKENNKQEFIGELKKDLKNEKRMREQNINKANVDFEELYMKLF